MEYLAIATGKFIFIGKEYVRVQGDKTKAVTDCLVP